MSSNIEVQRVCQLCGKKFTARTTVTKYCSDRCSKKAYKLRYRESKILQSNDSKKLKSYANTLYWNETLREDTYKSKLDFANMINKFNLQFRPMNEFGPGELE